MMNGSQLGPRATKESAEEAERHTRVLIADGRGRVRSALRALLATVPGVAVVAEVGNARHATQLSIAGAADTVVVDVAQLEGGGMDLVRAIKAGRPMTRVIVLTADPWCRAASAEAGADAFLIKGCSLDELARAVTNGLTRVLMDESDE